MLNLENERAPHCKDSVMKAKKPTKIASAKTPSDRSTSSKAKPRTKTAKTKTTARPKKAAVKRIRKTTTAAAKIKPAVETEPAVQVKPVAKVQPLPQTEPKLEKSSPTVATSKSAAPAAKAPRKAPFKIPPIPLEGDKPAVAPVSGPGHRYALGPTPVIEKLETEGELPESYATQELLLAARDPHWLYAHWDLSAEQQRKYNAFSRDGHLVVRVYIETTKGKPAAEVHVHPESRHWFIHVERANTRYLAELGYYSASDKWTVVSTSTATLTPPDAVSADTSAEFSTIPFEVPMEKLLSLVKEAVQESMPLAQALQELREEHSDLPELNLLVGNTDFPQGEWTPEQERALAAVISMDHVRRVWMGSLEITELIRRQF